MSQQKRQRLIDDNEFFKNLFKKFDKGLMNSVESFRKQVNVSLQKLEGRLQSCENTMNQYIDTTKKSCDKDLVQAETLVNKELRSKIIISQWTNKFLATAEQTALDPVTFAISRFCLNVGLSFTDVSPQYILTAKLHNHLIDYVAMETNYLIVGPALIGLIHISLYPELKIAIVSADGLTPVLKVLVHSRSKPLLALGCKLIASLALEDINKTIIARSGCLHALFDLVLGQQVEVDEEVQRYAVAALVNSLHHSDANRRLAVELTGVKPLLMLIRTTSNPLLLTSCARCVANIAMGNAYTAHQSLQAGAGEIIVELLDSVDGLRQPLLVHAMLAALSNLCGGTEENQTAVGNSKGLIAVTLRVLQHSDKVFVITEAANLLLALAWRNTINKSRIANFGGFNALMPRIIRHNALITQTTGSEREAQILCLERLCLALASSLLYRSTHERLNSMGGLEDLIKLMRSQREPRALVSLAKALVPLVPTAMDLLLVHKDHAQHAVEKAQALPVLKKAALQGFPHLPQPPAWLQTAITILQLPDNELADMAKEQQETGSSKDGEYVDGTYMAKEFITEIRADATVNDSRDFRGFLFSIY